MLTLKPNVIFLSGREKVFRFNHATQSVCGLKRQDFGLLFYITTTDSVLDIFEALQRAKPPAPLIVIIHPLYSEYFEPHIILDSLNLLDFNCLVYLYFETIDFRDTGNIRSALNKLVSWSKYRQVKAAFIDICDQQKIFDALNVP